MRTFGVEEELLLVDAQTGVPVSTASEILISAARQAPEGFTVVAEMHEELLELVSRPHNSLEGLRADVVRARHFADESAARFGARAVPLATSPLATHPHPSPGRRFRRIVDRYGVTSLRCMTCGLHVHVKVESPEEGVAVLDHIRVWLPVIRALAANSPFHDGVDTGYASYRFVQWSQWPSSGPAEVYGCLAGYRAARRELLATGALLDAGMLYLDARLSERYPTVEVRVADVPLLAEDTVTFAGLIRGMVASAAKRVAQGEVAPSTSAAAIRLASWTASLEGTRGALVHPLSGEPAPAAEVVEALLTFARPGLDEHGDEEPVRSGVERILREGSGAAIQRRDATATGSLSRMVLMSADLAQGHIPRPTTTATTPAAALGVA